MPASRSARPLWIACLFWLSTLVSGLSTLPAADPQVADGFTIEKVAGFPLLHRPIFAGFDDQGMLYVGESSGENLNRDQMLAKKPHWISRLEDTDGDGTFDKSTKFVENITLPQGCLWYRGSLYATCPPSIWKFTDTDHDGVADQREEILTGFGFSGNACDTHGPFLSPTGRLYIVQGRHGHEFKDKNGQVYSKGKAGRIYSCRPDGSDVRVHAGGGFDNPVEVDFTEEGECIGTVNILYRDRGDCLMHWVEGGVYPREDQADAIAEFKWTGGLLGPIHNLGHVAVSGIMRYRGTHLGEAYKDRWFFTEFNTHKVRYAELKRSGSTFTADIHEFLHCDDGDFHPTDVLEDADGSLLVLNTGGWFLNGCPTSRVAKPEIYGGVYRVRKTDGVKVNDPWGKELALAKKKPAEWVDYLTDARPAVKEQAIEFCAGLTLSQFAESLLASLQYKTVAASDVKPSSEQLMAFNWVAARRQDHAYWACIPTPLTSDDAEVRLSALVAVGDVAAPIGVVRQLQKGVVESNPAVRRDSLMSLIRLYGAAASHPMELREAIAQSIFEAAQRSDNDAVLNHLMAYAVIRLDAKQVAGDRIQSDNAAVQRIALIALDQMDNSPLTREMVLPLLSSEDARLQQTALEVIARRPGWAQETLELLKTWIAEPELSADRANALRGFLLAQLGDPSVQAFLAATLQATDTAPAVRTLCWEILQRATLPQWPEAWQPLLAEALQSTDEAVSLPALRIITQRSLTGFAAPLQQIAASPERSLTTRCEAVAAVGTTAELPAPVFEFLLSRLQDSELSAQDRASVCRALGGTALSTEQLRTLASSLDAAGPLGLSVVLQAYTRSTEDRVGAALVSALRESTAVEGLSADELASVLRRYSPMVQQLALPLVKKLGLDLEAQERRLAELAPSLEGGDAKAGRAIFFGRKAACASCHAVAGEGGRVGPHLTTIGASRTAKDLLEAIVYPSASFVNGYRPYVAAMDSGKLHQGVISAETTDTITLRTQDLQELRLRRDEVEELKESSTSIMPKGLDTQLTAEELQNLLAYLRSLK